jgi:uncharacterized RDD family membrane protein YckC
MGGMSQGGDQPGMDQPGMDQPGMDQPGMDQPGAPGGEPQRATAGPQWRPEWGPGPLGHEMPAVPMEETRVSGRRVVQYIIDAILSSIIPTVLYWALDRWTGAAHVLGVTVAAILSAASYVWYWVLRPHSAGGQTFGMQLLGIRVISKDGGRAGIGQLAVRWIFLILDGLVVGLVGLVTMLCSRHRQRIGDHVARTLVVRAEGRLAPAEQQSADATVQR